MKTTGTLVSLPPYGSTNHEMLEKYAGLLEQRLEDFPANWLWTHNRWKELEED